MVSSCFRFWGRESRDSAIFIKNGVKAQISSFFCQVQRACEHFFSSLPPLTKIWSMRLISSLPSPSTLSFYLKETYFQEANTEMTQILTALTPIVHRLSTLCSAEEQSQNQQSVLLHLGVLCGLNFAVSDVKDAHIERIQTLEENLKTVL